MKDIPAPPDSLPRLIAALEHGLGHAAQLRAGARAIGDLRAVLFEAPGREDEALALWREALASSECAWHLAHGCGAAPGAAACGALLHRAGEALALKMLAQAETETGVRIDDASKSDLCSAHARDLTQGMVHVWQLPEAVGACVVGWRSLGEFTAVSAESAAVYFGHMFAAELLHPQFSAPGALDAAAQAAGLDASTLGCLRAGRARIRALVDALQ